MKRAIVKGVEIQKETKAQRKLETHTQETGKATARQRRDGGKERRQSEGDRACGS